MNGEKSMKMIKLIATPSEALMDEEIRLVVTNLKSLQNITVVANVTGARGDNHHSHAHYEADNFGTVDISRDESKGGSYTGVFSMGLFCTMTPSPLNKHQSIRLTIQNLNSPLQFHIIVFDQHVTYDESIHKESLSKIVVERRYKSTGVKREIVRDGRLRGSLFIPEGAGPFPAVVDIFGAAGGLTEFRAALLASRGFLTLALAFFGYEDLPKTPSDIDLEYFEEAKNYLIAHKASQRGGIGIVGMSLGGTIALAVASYIPDYNCCVAINGPVFAFNLNLRYKRRMWIGAVPDMKRLYIENNGANAINMLDDYLTMPLDCNSILEFNKSQSSIMLIFSGDDKTLKAYDHQKMAENILRGSRVDYCIIVYSGAGHLLDPPFSAHSPMSYAKVIRMTQHWGGNAVQHSLAQSQAWSAILQYLGEKLQMYKSKL